MIRAFHCGSIFIIGVLTTGLLAGCAAPQTSSPPDQAQTSQHSRPQPSAPAEQRNNAVTAPVTPPLWQATENSPPENTAVKAVECATGKNTPEQLAAVGSAAAPVGQSPAAADLPRQEPLPLLPAPAQKRRNVVTNTTTAQQPAKAASSHTVGSGENLYSIAAKAHIYNEGLLWPLIYKANRDQIKDPQQIFPGQHLNIPRNISEEEKEISRDIARKSGIFLP